MKIWASILLLIQFFLLSQIASATSINSLEYVLSGEFQAMDVDGNSHDANVTGWLNVDLLSHTVYNADSSSRVDDLGHIYNLSYQIDVNIDVGNNSAPNDHLFSYVGTSDLHLAMMADIYLDLGEFGRFSTWRGGEGVLPWGNNGEVWVWHDVNFDLHDLTYMSLSSNPVNIGDLWTGSKSIYFTEVRNMPIPEPSTIFLFIVGLLLLYETNNKRGTSYNLRTVFLLTKVKMQNLCTGAASMF